MTKTKVSKRQFGRVAQQVAKCGGCGDKYPFSFWTKFFKIREYLVHNGWGISIEYGLMCPNCVFDLFEDCTFDEQFKLRKN
mgnify:CR=1 FL=1